MLGDLGRRRAASECFEAALTIEPDNPVYCASVAGAYAAEAAVERDEDLRAALRAKAGLRAKAALHALAPVYRRTLELHHPPAAVRLRDTTLDTLGRAYGRLGDGLEQERIEALQALHTKIEDAMARRDTPALRRLSASFGDGREWEREQAHIALARTLGWRGKWTAAAREYGAVIDMLSAHRPQGIAQHSLHAKHARALRNAGRPQDALAEATRGQLQDPLSATARREVGKAHFALLQFEEALEAWQHTLWLTPNDPVLHWKVGFCHWSVAQERREEERRREALEAAAERFEHAAALFGAGGGKGWAWSRLWAGRVMTELGDQDEAVRHLRTAAGCKPSKLAGSLLLGELLCERGDVDAAFALFATAQALAARLPESANADADWGETLPVGEVASRAHVLQAADAAERRAA
jgi:tetratricopeptide (TPR) repeat protein